MMNRRDFVRNTALGIGGAAALGQWSEDLSAFPYDRQAGLQLYTVREQAAKDLPGTLSRVAEIGYKEVEMADQAGRTPAEWRKLLADRGLTMPSGHYQTAQIKSGWEKHIATAGDLGLKYMVLAFLDPRERNSLDDYKKLSDLFNKAGEQTRQAGIQFCYHNHNFEFIKYGQATGFDVFLKQTDPKLVNFELDCFWVARAGLDPVKFINDNPGRFPLLHIKDMKPGLSPTTVLEARREEFVPVGQGAIDWKRLFAAAKKGGLEHYYVEQDLCEGSPFDAISASFQYLKTLQV